MRKPWGGGPLVGDRFTDNTDGTVTDNLTGLIWLQQANCGGTSLWQSAEDFATALYDGWDGDGSGGDCDLTDNSTAGDWRQPTIKELQSLMDYSYTVPALSNDAGTGQWTSGVGSAFSGVQSSAYWSSTSYADFTDDAWFVDLNVGFVFNDGKTSSYHYVWPVRGGQ
jgi:hypothetical protein